MKRLSSLTLLYIDFATKERKEYLSTFQKYLKEVYVADENLFQYYSRYKPDIIVIDLLVKNSLRFIRKVREIDENVIIMALTRDSSVKTLMDIVELSFSSYLLKPISEKELKNELIKISKDINDKDKIMLPHFCQWDIKSKTLFHKDEVISLTRRESKLFELLIQKQGKFCSDDEILYYVWSDDFDSSVSKSSIRTLIKNLRKKLPKGLIENQYGVGYKLVI
ncbi:MAG: response regulator transcription factor [Epsilonproteobacteria bacterium]|nr:response regulator transcription factor [Campylobacterota bacterium]